MTKRMTKAHLPMVTEMFNQFCEESKLYKPMTAEMCDRQFLTGDENRDTYAFVWDEDDSDCIIGFSTGCVPKGGKNGYITFVYVEPSWRRDRFGQALLEAVENAMMTHHPELEKIDIVFFNPVQLPWQIPFTRQGHDHPCAPGVDMSSQAFLFFKNRGYRCYAYQNAYYQNLESYQYPPDILAKIDNLAKADIQVTYYDRTKHTGLAELFDDLQNPGWKKAILANEGKGEQALPLLVAVYQDRLVCGYTGPLSVSPSGRGCFHGIGVHHDYRQHGAGKVLFSTLCMALKEQGSTFMSLYTGEDNPARNIYEAAGFKIVRSFADMRKILIK